MLSFYLYGIVVIIALVLLIVFNVRAAKKRQEPKKSIPPDNASEGEKQPNLTAARSPGITRQTAPSDDDYRQALRQFHTKDEKTSEDPGNSPRLDDAGYRESLRTMHKQE